MKSSKEIVETLERNLVAQAKTDSSEPLNEKVMALRDFLTMGFNITKLAPMTYGVRNSKEEGLTTIFMSVAESIKVPNPSESIIEKSKVLIKMEPETSRSKVL